MPSTIYQALAAACHHPQPETVQPATTGLACAFDHLMHYGALASPYRFAHLAAQCAHESQGFRRTSESLNYTSPKALARAFGARLDVDPDAADHPLLFNAPALANTVYADRLGNGSAASGDGFRYRGRGYIHLTGRANYAAATRALGVDFVSQPDLAEEPRAAWAIAAWFFHTRIVGDRSLFQWADDNNAMMITKGVNGAALLGLDDRAERARNVLGRLAPRPRPLLEIGAQGPMVERLQAMLIRIGLHPGLIDGLFGPLTAQALAAFQAAEDLPETAQTCARTWARMEIYHDAAVAA